MQLFNPVLGSFQNNAAASTRLRGAITYAAGTTGAIGATTLFTVTGDVAVTFLAAKSTTSLTSAGAPTFTLGVTGATDILTKTYPNVTGWTTGLWADSTTPSYVTAAGKATNLSTLGIAPIVVSANIIQTIAAATITGGVVRWYLQYIPLSSDGLVTLHANLVAF